MKILIVLIKWEGGVGRVVNSIKPLLEKEGHKVKIISREDDLRYFSTKDAFFKMRRIVKNTHYDILYTQDWSCALPLLFFPRHYCFFHGHSLGAEYPFQYIVGKFMGERLITGDFLNSKRFKCHFIPNGVNIDKFKPLNKKRKYLGWIKKKTETITKEQIEEIGAKLKIPIKIAESIPPNKMNDFYNSLKIFISLPPEQAGCQLSYMEAMASGVPIIIGNDNGEGFKYPFKKAKTVNEVILAIKNSKKTDYRGWLIENNLTWEDHASKLLKLINP